MFRLNICPINLKLSEKFTNKGRNMDDGKYANLKNIVSSKLRVLWVAGSTATFTRYPAA